MYICNSTLILRWNNILKNATIHGICLEMWLGKTQNVLLQEKLSLETESQIHALGIMLSK